MSRSTLLRIAIGLAIAVLVWGVLAVARGPVSDRATGLALPRIDTAVVDTVALLKRADTTVLARGANGVWRANGYPAASGAITGLLRALADTTRWSELMSESRVMHRQMGVTADSGERVRVAGHGHTWLDLMTGKRTSDGTGIFVRLAGADPVYALHGTLADVLDRATSAWRDERIAAVKPDSVATVEVRRGSSSYTLRRAGTAWHLSVPGVLDTTAVSGLLAQYRALEASGFAGRAQADAAPKTPPVHVALLDTHGASLVALGFDSTTDGVFARADTGGVTFRLEAWQLRQLAPAASQLVKKSAKPAPKS